MLNAKLITELRVLVKAFREKGVEFREVIKRGRTQLKDVVPMPPARSFAFAESLPNEIFAFERVETVLYEVTWVGLPAELG